MTDMADETKGNYPEIFELETVEGTETPPKVKLKRTIGTIGAIGLITGCIIGSGIFLTPKYVIEGVGSIGLFFIIWTLSGIIAIFGGLCYAELGTMIPKSGAEYNYIYESFGPIPAFLFVWANMLCIKPASLTIIAITCAQYVSYPFYQEDSPLSIQRMIAAFVIFSVSFINIMSTKWAISVNNVLNYSKFLCIFVIIGIGIYRSTKGGLKNFENGFENSSYALSSWGSPFFSALWAYDGWNNLNYAAEEMKDTKKMLPRSIIVALTVVCISYILVNMSYTISVGRKVIKNSSAIAIELGVQNLGVMAWCIPVFVALSTFGAAIGSIFGNGRILFVAGREGHLPIVLSSIHKKLKTPMPSLFFTMIVALIILCADVNKVDNLLEYFFITSWIFYGTCFVSLIYLRFKRPDMIRPYKVFIVLPFIMVIVSVILIILPFIKDWKRSFIAPGVILSGLPFYFLFIHYKHKLPTRFFKWFEMVQFNVMEVYDLVPATREEEMG